MPWKRYRYGPSYSNPMLSYDDAPWPSAAQVRLAGFDPEDEELAVTRLMKPWNGHRRGAVVLTGLTVEGHPFAIRYQFGHEPGGAGAES